MIVLDNVSKAYPGTARPAVDRVSLEVPTGQLLVLLGGSGSGKTTTLKMINRLIEPKQAFPPYDALLLLSPPAAGKPGLLDALRPLVGAIDLPTMQRANLRVDVERQSPQQAATELLERVKK
ncbi:MAG: ATP-binding cassette domain-containing protein [Gemmataceae bacterium]|nr:ATP-binding cassette domain-containing protein [Gemmataceae bacterium]